MATQRQRHPHGIYADDPWEPGTNWRGNLPSEERLLRLLRLTATACKQVEEAHGDDCDCDWCLDVQGILFSIRMFEGALASQLTTVEDGGRCPAGGPADPPKGHPPAADSAPPPACPDNPFYGLAPR